MPQPQVGEIRRGATETVKWTGDRWEPIIVDPSDEKGYHPGLADSEHPWLARLKGFFSGAAEAATPAKIGTAATLATALPSGGLSVPAAAILATLAESGAEAGRLHYDTANAAKTFPQAAMRAVEAGAAPVIGAGLGKATTLLKSTPTKVGGVVGGGIGAVEGYRRGGLPGAAEGAATGAVLGAGVPKSIQVLERLFGPEAAGAAEASVESRTPQGGFAGQPKTAPTGKQMRYNRDEPFPDTTENLRPPEDFWPARETEWANPPVYGDGGFVPTGRLKGLEEPEAFTPPTAAQESAWPQRPNDIGPSSGPSPSSPRLVGKPPSFNDELANSLQEFLTTPEPVVKSTSAPSTTTMTPQGRPAVGPEWYQNQNITRTESGPLELPPRPTPKASPTPAPKGSTTAETATASPHSNDFQEVERPGTPASISALEGDPDYVEFADAIDNHARAAAAEGLEPTNWRPWPKGQALEWLKGALLRDRGLLK